MNEKIETKNPDIKDIAPTILELFGVKIPEYIKGKNLLNGNISRVQMSKSKESKQTNKKLKHIVKE